MAQILRQSTQVIVVIGPFVDVTDGFTPETGITLGAADEAEILKANTTTTTDISAATWAAITGCDGWYGLTLTTSLTDTVGPLTVMVNDDSVCLPVFARFQVIEEAAYDAMYASSADPKADINVATIDAGAITAAAIATGAIDADAIADGAIDAAAFAAGAITATVIATGAIDADALAADAVAEIADGVWDEDATGHQTTGTFGQAIGDPVADTNTIYGAVVTGAAGATIAADIIAIQADTDDLQTKLGTPSNLGSGATVAANLIDIESQTDDIGAAGAGLTAVPWNASWDAEVQSEVDDALVAQRLDELLNADSDIDGAAPPTVGSVFHELLTKTAGSFTYDQTTDSLEALRDNTGTAGAGLTAIDLPDQTMNITGNITGNLSGSVGSVTGAVGSVTGNVGGTVNGLTAAALADFFDTDSGTTFGAAVAGSVVKEIADNAGGSSLTVQDIVDGVWDEAVASHVGAGSTGERLERLDIIASGGAGGLTNARAVALDNLDAAVTSRLAPTVAGRTLDVNLAGEAGLDLDNTSGTLAKGTDITGFNDLSAAQVNAEVDTALADVGLTAIVTGRIDAAISTRATQTSVDTIDDFLDTEIAAIKAKTDQLTFTVPTQLDANIQSINDTGVQGTGSGATPWAPV